MSGSTSLSEGTRLLTRISGAAFAALGLVLFVAPTWGAEEFAWGVTPFMTMTMGGWCLGNAFMAWIATRDWRWASVQAVLVYLWVFAATEVGVLVWFRDLIRFGGVLTWPYLLCLGLALVAAAVGAADLLRERPLVAAPADPPAPGAIRALGVVFVILVGFLAYKGLTDPEAARTRNVFPEPMSAFTIRAFAVFYGAIAAGAVPLVFARILTPTITYAAGGIGLIAPITVAAFAYIGVFDFSEHPRQTIYIGAYVGVLIAALGLMAWARPRLRPRDESSAPAASCRQRTRS